MKEYLENRYQDSKKEVTALLKEYEQYKTKRKQAETMKDKTAIQTKIIDINKAIRRIFNNISELLTFKKGLSDSEAIYIDRQIARFLGLDKTWTL